MWPRRPQAMTTVRGRPNELSGFVRTRRPGRRGGGGWVRSALAAGLGDLVCNRSFRATPITVCLQNGGSPERAQQLAAHESPRPAKLYDRTQDEIGLDEVERIQF